MRVRMYENSKTIPIIPLTPLSQGAGCLTTTLGDVADPGQGLVTTFLDDLHVSDLKRNERRRPRLRGESLLGPGEYM